MPYPEVAPPQIARELAEIIDKISTEKLLELLRRIADGERPDLVLRDLQATFGMEFADALTASFGELLARNIAVAEVLSLPISGVSLSRRLYVHAQEVSQEVQAVIREHLQGVIQARELALSLYDGYDPQDGIRRPLEGAARGELPKALRALTADKDARSSLTKLVERGQKQAARLKTAALRASYMEAFDAWEKGAGEKALRKRLDIAMREKNRYFANRIARTELARAHQAARAIEIMDEVDLSVVEVRMNPMHPREDVCDYHARANLYGLGPGLYPKAKAPVPPFHSHCWCRLRWRPDIDASKARLIPGAGLAFIRSKDPQIAARIMGSRERAADVLNGADPVEVFDRGKAAEYRTRTVADVSSHPLLRRSPQ